MKLANSQFARWFALGTIQINNVGVLESKSGTAEAPLY
jgi:hypothetical protein